MAVTLVYAVACWLKPFRGDGRVRIGRRIFEHLRDTTDQARR